MLRSSDSMEDLAAYLDGRKRRELSKGGNGRASLTSSDSDQLNINPELPPLFPGIEGLNLDLFASTTLPTETSLPVKLEIPPLKSEETPAFPSFKAPSKTLKRTTAPQTNRRPRKKQKVESGFIASLYGKTSDELIEYGKTHSLTDSQKKELKTHLRKIKNRESALLSRKRQRSHQDELEDQIHRLEKANINLERQCVQLEAENNALKGEFVAFQQMIAGLAKLYVDQKPEQEETSPVQGRVHSPSSRPGQPSSSSTETVQSKKEKPDDALGTFLQLLIVLHSFAPHFDSAVRSRINSGLDDVTAMSKMITVK